MLKGAMIGFSSAAETAYLPALAAQKESFNICAVCDPAPERLKRAKALLPEARLYDSAKTLFSKEERLELAVIASPAGRHAEHAMLALGNRAHVLCGAPLCLSMKELDRLWSGSVGADRCVFTVHGIERSPQLITLKRVIREELLGRVSYASLVFLRSRPAEAGLLADCGWQASWLAGELLGGEPLSLAAKLQKVEGGESAAAVAQLHFSDGAAHIRLAAGSHADTTKALLCGDKGLAQLDEDLLTLDLKDLGPETMRFRDRLSDGPRTEWLAGTLRDFLAALHDPVLREKNFRETKNSLKFLKNSAYSDSINSAAVPL